jgi:predicted lipoprotein with Yx(FWY)xxD motif
MRTVLVIASAVLAVIVAGCGSGSPTLAGARATGAAKHAVVKTHHGALGTYLVDRSGRTLYLFKKDTGRRSHCSGACAQNWPPVTTREKPEAEGGAKQSKLSTKRRADGSRQVLYNGHPLYRFIADTKAGQANGQGISAFGARWYVVAPSGKAITASPSAAATPGPAPSTY